MGGGGVRKEPKNCHVLFEWPQTFKKYLNMVKTNSFKDILTEMEREGDS